MLVTFWGPKFITLRMNCPHSNLSRVDPQIPHNCIVLLKIKMKLVKTMYLICQTVKIIIHSTHYLFCDRLKVYSEFSLIIFFILVTFLDETVRKYCVLVTFWGPKFITLRMNCPHSNLSRVDPQIPHNCIVLLKIKMKLVKTMYLICQTVKIIIHSTHYLFCDRLKVYSEFSKSVPKI